MPAVRLHPTPNPNSLKFTAEGATFIPSGLAAYRSPEEAADDPLGAALFAIEGVADVLLLPAFATVTKRPEAHWDRVLPEVQRTLEGHLETAAGG